MKPAFPSSKLILSLSLFLSPFLALFSNSSLMASESPVIHLDWNNRLAVAFNEILSETSSVEGTGSVASWPSRVQGLLIASHEDSNDKGGSLITCTTRSSLSRIGTAVKTFQGCDVTSVTTAPESVQVFTLADLLVRSGGIVK